MLGIFDGEFGVSHFVKLEEVLNCFVGALAEALSKVCRWDEASSGMGEIRSKVFVIFKQEAWARYAALLEEGLEVGGFAVVQKFAMLAQKSFAFGVDCG